MKKIDNRGFGKVEVIAILTLLVILFAIGSKLVIDTGKNYSYFKNVANNFVNSVSMYKDKYPKSDNTYYLSELIEKGYSDEIENPINTSQKCNENESYVRVEQTNSKWVYLVCGNNLVEGYQNGNFKVYEISEWSENKKDNYSDVEIRYNYMKNDKFVLDDYVAIDEFLKLYSENENITVFSLDEIQSSGYLIVTKDFYRQKTLVKELK